MVQQLRLCLIAFTFLGSATVAFAQNLRREPSMKSSI